MARRRKLNWGAFGAEGLMGFGEGMQGWGQMTQERERYQTDQAGRVSEALARQQLARKGTAAQGEDLLGGVREQYPHANMSGPEAMMAASTLNPEERMSALTEQLRPDMSDAQQRQLYESMNLHQMEGGEPWQAQPASDLTPGMAGPLREGRSRTEGYAPGGSVEQAQNIFRGLGEETGRTEQRLLGLERDKLLEAHKFSLGEGKVVKDKDGKNVLIFYKVNPVTGVIEVKQADDEEWTQYSPRNDTQLQELINMGLFGDLAGRTPPPVREGLSITGVTGTGEDAEVETGLYDPDRDYGDPANTQLEGVLKGAEEVLGDIGTGIKEGAEGVVDFFTMDPESWGHESWSNRPRHDATSTTDPQMRKFEQRERQAEQDEISGHLGYIQQRWNDLQQVAAEGDAGTAQALMKDLMHYVTSPDVAHILTDEGKQRILAELGHFPVQPPLPEGGILGEGRGQALSDAGYPWNPLDPKYKDAELNVGGGTARRPFDLSREQGTASSSVVPDIQGGLGARRWNDSPFKPGRPPGMPPQEELQRPLPSSSQQLPPLTGGQTVPSRTPPQPFDLRNQPGIAPSTQVPNIQGGLGGPPPPQLPSGGQQLPPLTSRPSMPPGLPQPGTGRPDIQTPMTPRQPLPQAPTGPRGRPQIRWDQLGTGGPPDIQGGLTPRQPFPPSEPRMTQRPQGPPPQLPPLTPPGFDLNQMPGIPQSQQVPQIRGGIGGGRGLGAPENRRFFEQDNWALPTQMSKPSEEVFKKAGAVQGRGIGTQAGAEKLESEVKAYAMGNDNPFAQDMPQQTPEQRRAMWAMMRRWISTESKGQSVVESGAAAHGVLQVIESKARADLIKDGVISERDYPNWKTDPQENMEVAMLYLHRLASKPGGNYGWSTAHDALSAYHAGPTLYSAYRDAVNNEGHDANVDFTMTDSRGRKSTYGSRSRNYANSILNAMPPEMVDELDKYFKQAALGAGRQFKNREGKAEVTE